MIGQASGAGQLDSREEIGVPECFGGFDRGIAAGLAIRHDHGSAYKSHDFQRELTFLGLTGSSSFVREPHTVNEHTKAIYRHFRARSRAELLARWIRRGRGGQFPWSVG
jgi:hypothetical protein